ncbi:hypothetical protein DYB38_003424 [Aphanomyces astaci]|uniref:Uncharacterized protein n=1 Tax=Aphanomyces astaci TaxID=112090 RepID=A0A397D2F0_APHAT|nr:hypothetical protein DYB34_001015 [Aphanomyces astaci]RHY54662.1 hypothetical protein DYB38_003424 [Aphanomyces astaci]RHZ12363.1 hypothetical protein DYB31_004113 [Aphanomyces astaci]
MSLAGDPHHHKCHPKLLKQCMRDVARRDAFLIKKALDAVTYFARERPYGSQVLLELRVQTDMGRDPCGLHGGR